MITRNIFRDIFPRTNISKQQLFVVCFKSQFLFINLYFAVLSFLFSSSKTLNAKAKQTVKILTHTHTERGNLPQLLMNRRQKDEKEIKFVKNSERAEWAQSCKKRHSEWISTRESHANISTLFSSLFNSSCINWLAFWAVKQTFLSVKRFTISDPVLCRIFYGNIC